MPTFYMKNRYNLLILQSIHENGGGKIRPMHDSLEMADQGQHGEHRLHQQAVLPRAALTQCEVGRIALRGMEAGITQDNHAFLKLSNQTLKGVIDVSTTILSSRHFLLDSCDIP